MVSAGRIVDIERQSRQKPLAGKAERLKILAAEFPAAQVFR